MIISLDIPDELYSRVCESLALQHIADHKTAIMLGLEETIYQSVDTEDSQSLMEWYNGLKAKLATIQNPESEKCQS